VVSANENFLKIFGYELDEVVGKHHRIFCDSSYAASAEPLARPRRRPMHPGEGVRRGASTAPLRFDRGVVALRAGIPLPDWQPICSRTRQQAPPRRPKLEPSTKGETTSVTSSGSCSC
jgi:hypothetical protein